MLRKHISNGNVRPDPQLIQIDEESCFCLLLKGQVNLDKANGLQHRPIYFQCCKQIS
uniref:Uncharacterized protein n=1 Tax=Anguilla anguilla TaxID=7936 RepID=A0A0E9UR58_ANGAN